MKNRRYIQRFQWSQWLRRFYQQYWIPLLLGCVLTLGVLGLWQQLRVQEQLHIAQLVQQEADAIGSELNRELSTRILTLERMAHRWQASGGTPKRLWEADVENYLAHAYGHQAIEWVDPSSHVRWISPLKGNEAAQDLDLAQETRRHITLDIARELNQTLLTRTISLSQGGQGFLAVVPLFLDEPGSEKSGKRFDGFIVGVFRYEGLFDSTLRTSPLYQVQIYDRKGLIYSQGIPPMAVSPKMVVVQAYGADWQVQVFPTQALIAKARSPLPAVVLWGGLVGSWTLATAVFLGQRLERYVRQVKQVNQQLQQEMAERQHMEAELRHSETANRNLSARLELAVQSAHIGIWDWDIVGDRLIWNDQMYTLYGLPPSDFSGDYETWSNTLHPDDVALATTALQQAIRGERDYGPEFRIIHPDGTVRFIQSHAVVQRDSQGRAQRMIGVNFDITDRKDTETALKNSQERFAGILEIASDAIISIDSTQRITLFNKGAERTFGYQAEEIVGHPLAMLLPERFGQGHHHHITQYAHSRDGARQMAQRGTIWGRRKDGTEFPAEASIAKLTLNGEVTFTAFLQDITARQQAESAIAHLAAIVESSEDAIVSKSLEGIITSWNVAAEKLFGYTATEVVGQSIHCLIPEALLKEEQSILEQIRRGERITSYDTQRLRKDGTSIDVSISVSPIRDTAGNIIGASTISRDISLRRKLEMQQRQAEEERRQSEEKFRMAIDFTYNWEYWQAPDGTFVYISPSCERITGYTLAEFIDNPQLLDTIAHPGDRAILNCHTCHSEIVADSIEYRIITKSGEPRWISHSCQLIFDDNGQYLGIRASNRDIHEHKQAELALQESEARFQAFMNHSPTPAWITDAEGIMLYASQTYFHTFQLPTPDIIGRSIVELYPQKTAQKFLQTIQTVAQTQQVIEAIEIVPRQNGTIGHFLVYEFPIPGPSEQLMVGGVAIDVTQQYQAEADLRYQKEMFQAIVDHIPVMIALFNHQGHMEFINPELERTLGWCLEDWKHRNIMVDCYPDPSYRQGVLEHMLAAMGTWRDFTTQNAAGQTLETSWVNIPLSGGQFLGIGQDISDRKHKEIALRQAMEAAEAANLAKSMFLANMSHELRTPLNVILGFTQVMAHDVSLTPGQREDLQTIQRSGDHLLNLINDVLDLSKIEAGHCMLEAAGFDLIALLHTLRRMVEERAAAKRLQVTFEIAADVPQFVIADEQKLRQVLLNLLSNAVKFTQQGGVTLKATALPSQKKAGSSPSPVQTDGPFKNFASTPSCTLCFEIIDTGIGIDESEQNTIFDAFTQAAAGRKSTDGTGLGLSISRKLLELMGGKISVRSVPTVGSTFTVIVPVCPTSGIHIQHEHYDRMIIGLIPGQPHHRILIVDDQPENRLLMVRLLSQLGLEIREATNGQEAITVWQEWRPDLTWMDIRMPGVDGYEATKQIRAMEQEKASIIIALTAQASQSDRTLALNAGCNDYISKPFREETVFLKMSEYLGLEYLYAAVSPPPTLTSPDTFNPYIANDGFNSTSLNLDLLPLTWLKDVEVAAICGNDRAIAALVEQLSPEFSHVATCFLNLAGQFQFEQILNLLQSIPSQSQRSLKEDHDYPA